METTCFGAVKWLGPESEPGHGHTYPGTRKIFRRGNIAQQVPKRALAVLSDTLSARARYAGTCYTVRQTPGSPGPEYLVGNSTCSQPFVDSDFYTWEGSAVPENLPVAAEVGNPKKVMSTPGNRCRSHQGHCNIEPQDLKCRFIAKRFERRALVQS
eukprot:2098762-Rhodomonas_salina.1